MEGNMHKRLSIALLMGLIFALFSLPTFGEGEWEYESGDTAPVVEAEAEAGAEAEVQETTVEIAQLSVAEVGDDEPSLPPRLDTFPIVRADEAPAPRPRNPQRILEAVDSADLSVKLAADRLLLAEIRKDVPEAIQEAALYLDRLKELAARSDPVRLVQLFDRVLDQAPIYFRWLETEYETQDEQITEYYVGGARGFAFAMENFRSAVFFVIMNRLDIASRVISELN
jgi:hypothetical protein